MDGLCAQMSRRTFPPLMTGVVVALVLLLGEVAAAQVPGWDSRWPPPEKMLQGQDPAKIQEFRRSSDALKKNPKDIDALNRRGWVATEMSHRSLYRMYWQWLAAKDLEQVIQLDPKNFAGWHNYGNLNYLQGDLYMINDHSNARRAVWAFTKAIELNPKSARSYMGRGWAYLTMNDQAQANADFQKTLQLDPTLRADLEKEARGIQGRKRQEAGARGTVKEIDRLGHGAGSSDDYFRQRDKRDYDRFVREQQARDFEGGGQVERATQCRNRTEGTC